MHEFFTPGYSGDTVQLLAGGQKLTHLNGNKQRIVYSKGQSTEKKLLLEKHPNKCGQGSCP